MSSAFAGLTAPKATTSAFTFPSTAQPTATTQATTTNMFAGLTAPTSTTSTTGSTPAPTTGFSFGGLGLKPATNTTAAPSLFGQSTQPTTTTSLFGATAQPSNNTAPVTTTSGLFGANNTQPSSGSALFGSTLSQPQQNAGISTVFGQNQQSGAAVNSTTQHASQSQLQQHSGAYFDSLLEKSRKRTHGQTALEELPSLQLGLGDLRSRIKKLGPNAQKDLDGRAQYLLAGSGVDLGVAVRDLTYLDVQMNRERQQSGPPNTSDVEGYLANLQSQTTLSMIADGLAKSARDFDTFLEENVTMEWDAQRKRIYQHFGLNPKDAPKTTRDGRSMGESSIGEGAFGRSRRAKTQSIRDGLKVGAGESVFGRSGMQKSVIGSTTTVGSRSHIPFVDVEKSMEAAGSAISSQDDRQRREKQSSFSVKVQNLNSYRIQQQAYPIVHEFSAVQSSLSGEYVEHVVKAYNALIEITGESPEAQDMSAQGALKERQFADAYLDENRDASKSRQIRTRVISGASQHLEKQFFQELESLIAKNPREANLGGVPNVMSKVRAYIRLQAARKNLVPDDTDLQQLGDDYVWALVYFLLRAGHVNEAVQYVADNNIAFRAIDRNFITYITDYNKSGNERKLRRELQDRINNEYNQRVRIAPEHSIDPFRMACYNIIGRCDLVKRSLDGINHGMEDWLWLQFVLAREAGRHDETANESYGLREVQETIDNVVNKHGQGVNGFGVFFYIQILAGRFEQAIRFLYTHQYVDALHFAIALDYYGLLRIAGPTAPEGELLSFNTKNAPQISYARMIGYYTQDFRAANVVAAVDYLTLICLNKDLPGDAGAQQAAQCHEALRELVLETREFAQLLGDVQNSGQYIKGAIEERIKLLGLEDTNEFMRNITIQAAAVADDNGRTTDAVLLYHLAGEYDYVTAICNRALSEAISVDIGQDPISLIPAKARAGVENQNPDDRNSPALSLTSCDNPYTLARTIAGIYYDKPMFRGKINPQTWNTLEVLVRIHSAKELVADGRYSPALDSLSKLEIIPIANNPSTTTSDPNYIRHCASKYSTLDPSISRLIPSIIKWTIYCSSNLRRELMSSPYANSADNGRGHLKDTLSGIGRDLMIYGGFLKYRLPGDVFELLVRCGSE